jgi:hypothetical protein
MNKASYLLPSIGIVLLSILFMGCGDSNVPDKKIDASTIVGQPIITETEPEIDPDLNTSLVLAETAVDSNESVNESNQTQDTEGLIVNGKIIEGTDQNVTAIDYGVLPPLDKDSPYQVVFFPRLTEFKYEVDWERDGLDFDFAAYCQRVPAELRKLSASKVAIEGFMIPTIVDENNEVKEFLLLPDQLSCCFGQTPEANGWIVVSAEKGVEVLMDRVIRVSGELTVEERWDEEFFVGLYHLTCEELTGPSL